MDKTEAYREHLVGLACEFAQSNRGVDDYAAIEIAELLDEHGNGKYIPSRAIEDMNHIDSVLKKRLLKQSREHEAWIEANKTTEQRVAEQEEEAKEQRKAIYRWLSEGMQTYLMHRLAGKHCFCHAGTLKALHQQDLIDGRNDLTPLGRRIAEGIIKNNKGAYQKILAAGG